MRSYGAPPTAVHRHGDGGRIDREALVRRHNPVIREADALEPLSVGNGEFCFTADITGLQTFPEFHSKGIPLCILSNWGWHSHPNPNNYKLEDVLSEFDVYGRKVKVAVPENYPTKTDAYTKAVMWLRGNPHRLGLGQVGLNLKKRDGALVALEDCKDIEQTLDMYSGMLTSRFIVEGKAVEVETCCHPTVDMIAVRIKSTLISTDQLGVKIRFPYGSMEGDNDPGDWDSPECHETTIIGAAGNRIDLKRTLDDDSHYISIMYSDGGRIGEADKHHYELNPNNSRDGFEFVIAFSPDPLTTQLPGVTESRIVCEGHWKDFWNNGGAIDLSACTDSRANELERRIVLSQYLMATQESGKLPPQETGLTCNSWYGKFHLEMHWWHGVQFALWGRLPLLEKTLPWYQSVLPRVQEETRMQGYPGARWQKMVGPDGRTGPNGGVLLVWQQPHPIYYAELCYREHRDRACLERYCDIVFESAEFMAAYAHWDKDKKRYVLGPPLLLAQENFGFETYNPTYELEYWRWGLETAQKWRVRLGLDRKEKWDHVITHLSKLPVKDGLYLAAESVPHTWTDTTCRRNHPTLLAACGLLPGVMVDREVMNRTLEMVMEKWNWKEKTWGWDFPMTAMTAARLGKPEIAIDALMMETDRNVYLRNGHNHRKGMIVYLPANGGLLTAVAMMAAGWDGAPRRDAPGFPDNGKWDIRWEGLCRMP